MSRRIVLLYYVTAAILPPRGGGSKRTIFFYLSPSALWAVEVFFAWRTVILHTLSLYTTRIQPLNLPVF